jgi:hypothetical protein
MKLDWEGSMKQEIRLGGLWDGPSSVQAKDKELLQANLDALSSFLSKLDEQLPYLQLTGVGPDNCSFGQGGTDRKDWKAEEDLFRAVHRDYGLPPEIFGHYQTEDGLNLHIELSNGKVQMYGSSRENYFFNEVPLPNIAGMDCFPNISERGNELLDYLNKIVQPHGIASINPNNLMKKVFSGGY